MAIAKTCLHVIAIRDFVKVINSETSTVHRPLTHIHRHTIVYTSARLSEYRKSESVVPSFVTQYQIADSNIPKYGGRIMRRSRYSVVVSIFVLLFVCENYVHATIPLQTFSLSPDGRRLAYCIPVLDKELDKGTGIFV